MALVIYLKCVENVGGSSDRMVLVTFRGNDHYDAIISRVLVVHSVTKTVPFRHHRLRSGSRPSSLELWRQNPNDSDIADNDLTRDTGCTGYCICNPL